jgi:hypothetical protein
MNSPRLLLVSDFIAAIFILLFTYTALTKIFDINSFVFVLNKLKLFENRAGYAAWLIIIAELIVTSILIKRSLRLVGFYFSLVLMLSFTMYIAWMLLFAVKLPCSCGGVIGQLSWRDHLMLNIFLTLAASFGIFIERKRSGIENHKLI